MKTKPKPKSVITPKPLSGFPEWLPEEKILENKILALITKVYERYGFSPIETPAVERRETLLAKGGNEKEIYALSRLKAVDDDTKDLALHFDLTVPLARYVAQHYNSLAFPFRRYQIQKVWRGERPQAGRFREFYQADIDVIGENELSLLTDAELLKVAYDIFAEMNIGPFVIRVNNRKILQGYLEHLGVTQNLWMEVVNVVDNLEKVGVAQILSKLTSEEFGLSVDTARQLIDFISIESKDSSEEVLVRLGNMDINALFKDGVSELLTVVDGVRSLGVPEESFVVDLKIARGLDYYTGTVYETLLVQHPGVGSICSGGRYENLASHFIDKKLPGVGISIGVTRLLSRLLKAGILSAGSSTVAPVLVTSMDPGLKMHYLQLANALRVSGINTEVFFENKKIGEQLKFANRKKFTVAIIAGEREFSTNTVLVKNLKTGQQDLVSVDALTEKVLSILG